MKPGHRKRFPALLARAAEREEKMREAKKEEEEHEHQLAKARRRKELEAEEAGAATGVGNQHGTQGEMKTETIDNNLDLADKTLLPKDKQFHSFISHKKVTAIHFKCFAPAAC